MAASCLSEHPASGHSLPNRRTHAAGHPPQMLAARCGMIRRIFALLPSAPYPIRVVFHRVPSLHRTKITTFHDTAKLIGRFYRQILNIRAPCKEASVFPHGRRKQGDRELIPAQHANGPRRSTPRAGRLPAAQPERSRNAAEPCRPHRTGTGHPTGLCRPTFRNGILRNTSATDGTVRIRFGRMRTAGIRTTAPLPRAPRSSVPAAAIPDPPGKCPAQVEHVRPHRGAKSSGNIRLPPANPCRPEYACNSMHTSATPRRGETRKNVPPPQRQARIYLGRLSQ